MTQQQSQPCQACRNTHVVRRKGLAYRSCPSCKGMGCDGCDMTGSVLMRGTVTDVCACAMEAV